MAEQTVPDHLRTVVAYLIQKGLWIEAAKLELGNRIVRSVSGDIWLATYHQSTDDYRDSHVAQVKMLDPNQENTEVLLDKIKRFFPESRERFFSECGGLGEFCWLHGFSVLSGKICIVMKFYRRSLGDKMARRREGNLALPDVLRHGIDLAQDIMELNSRGIFLLNLKPSNVLLNEEDQTLLGDFGTPSLVEDNPLRRSEMARRLVTPNYLAPEQWQPEVRGPTSLETNAWGFGCTIVEMLTGVQPWDGKSEDEIFHFVVRKQEKPCIPTGLPPQLENVLNGCFEFDLRNRPLMTDILRVFRSVMNTINDDGSWAGLGTRSILEKSSNPGYTEGFPRKDHLQVGDTVRFRMPPNSCKPMNMNLPDGTIVGLDPDTDRDGFVFVKPFGIHDHFSVHISTLEHFTYEPQDGDIGTGMARIIGMESLRKGRSSEFQMAEYCVGQFVRLKANVLSPRFEWPRKRGGFPATGRIWEILPSGCLIVKFPGIFSFKVEGIKYLADPAEVEVVTFNTCPGILKKVQHLVRISTGQ